MRTCEALLKGVDLWPYPKLSQLHPTSPSHMAAETLYPVGRVAVRLPAVQMGVPHASRWHPSCKLDATQVDGIPHASRWHPSCKQMGIPHASRWHPSCKLDATQADGIPHASLMQLKQMGIPHASLQEHPASCFLQNGERYLLLLPRITLS